MNKKLDKNLEKKSDRKSNKYLFNFFKEKEDFGEQVSVYYRVYSKDYHEKTVGDYDGLFCSEKGLENLMKDEDFIDIDIKNLFNFKKRYVGFFKYFKENR